MHAFFCDICEERIPDSAPAHGFDNITIHVCNDCCPDGLRKAAERARMRGGDNPHTVIAP